LPQEEFTEKNKEITMAVEFVDHAACAHIAKNLNWYQEEGLKIKAFDNYSTGMALSAALARGDVDVAYVCLVPAINAYANGNVPIKIVAGTHKYGYGIIASEKITDISDLENNHVKIGCPREGSVMDMLLHKMIDKYKLDEEKTLKNIKRIPPAKILLALQSGELDIGFLPEQFATMGETLEGFKQLCSAKDLWPDMQGSVLVVSKNMIENHPEIVTKLVSLTKKGIDYIHANPKKAAEIVSSELSFNENTSDLNTELNITPQIIEKSLNEKMICTAEIKKEDVQQVINYLSELGYIKKFNAEDFLDVKFNEDK
jgi:NitT/TauT family transport system substrate-binding protein